MKKKILIAAVLFATLNFKLVPIEIGINCFAQSAEQPVAYTLSDRDRSIRTEEQLKALEEKMDVRFEAMNTRFESLQTLIYFILGGVFGLIGLIFLDRRSYIKPVKEDIYALSQSLREYSKKQPELADILRSHGIL